MVPFLKYSTLRLALFLLCMTTAYMLKASPVMSILIGGVVSALLSYVLLARQRDELSAALASRAQRRLERAQQDEAAEDAAADRIREQQEKG